MKKKSMVAVLAGVAVLMAGCAGGDGDSDASDSTPNIPEQTTTATTEEPIEEPIPEPEPVVPTPSGNYKLQTYEQTCTSEEGYAVKRTFQIGEMLRGDDQAVLDDAWLTVGGEGTAPTFDEEFYNYNISEAVYVYGTYTVENITGEGYSYDSLAPSAYTVTIGFLQGDDDEYGADYDSPDVTDLGGAQYSGSISVEDKNGGSGVYITPKMTSDKWGPVPFGMVVVKTWSGDGGLFPPKYPDGYPTVVSGSGLATSHPIGFECVPMFGAAYDGMRQVASSSSIPLSFRGAN